MKIALINPPYDFIPEKANVDAVYLSGIAYVGAALKNAGHEIECIDFKYDKNASLEQALDSDVIGIATYINSYRFLKSNIPKLEGKVISLGGPLISSYGEKDNLLLRIFPEVDYGFI